MAADPRHPEIDAESIAYYGYRCRVEAQLAPNFYGVPFAINVAFAETMNGPRPAHPLPLLHHRRSQRQMP